MSCGLEPAIKPNCESTPVSSAMLLAAGLIVRKPVGFKSTLTSGIVVSVSSTRIPCPPSTPTTSPPPLPDPVVKVPARQPV